MRPVNFPTTGSSQMLHCVFPCFDRGFKSLPLATGSFLLQFTDIGRICNLVFLAFPAHTTYLRCCITCHSVSDFYLMFTLSIAPTQLAGSPCSGGQTMIPTMKIPERSPASVETGASSLEN